MGFVERIASFFFSSDGLAPADRPGRNEPCWCGSGRKYKKCHLEEDCRKALRHKSSNCGPV